MTNKQKLELKVGEMPQPCYLTKMGNTSIDSDGSSIRWIGMQAYGLSGQLKDFLWWRNFKAGNLNRNPTRQEVSAFITRLYLEMEAEAAIGLPIDLHSSDQSRDYVAIVKDNGVYGVYVQADKRQMFNFMTMMKGIRSEEELRRGNPAEFDRILSQAEKVLPYKR